MPTLREIFSDIADAIRTKTGKSVGIYPVDMASEIERIESGGDYKLEKMPSGAISSFNDGAALPMPSLKVGIEPQQDLHGYDSPWVGGSGKNKAKVTDKGKNGITLLNTYNCTLQISGNEFILTPTASSVEAYFSSISFSSSSSESNFNTFYSVPIKENTQYTFNLSNNNFDKNIIQFFDDSYNIIDQYGASYKQFDTNTGIVTAPTGATWMVCRIGMSSGTAGTAYKTTLQIEEGSTATTFAPYSNICPISGWDEVDVTVADDVETPTVSNVYTIDLDGTRYGGKLDVVSGVLTVDRAEVIFDGSNDEGWTINNNCHCTYVENIKQSTTQSATNFITIANEYKPNGVRYRDDITESGIAKTIGANNQIAIKDTNYSTSDSWREFLASKPLQVVYELATPITYQLTPTAVKSLLGTNNIWADTGDIIEGEYFKGAESSGSGIIYYIKNIRIECEVI